MLKEFIKYLMDQARPETVEHAGKMYSTRELNPLAKNLPPDVITLRSLESFAVAVKHLKDEGYVSSGSYLIHIQTPCLVQAVSTPDEFGARKTPFVARVERPQFAFGVFTDSESFLIGLHSFFQKTEPALALIRVVSSLSSGKITTSKDDGISQTVEVKAGVTLNDKKKIDNPIMLKPWRTFHEAEQPESKYILRVKQKDDERPQLALFNSENDFWELQAMQNIKKFLDTKIEGLDIVL
jgi:hypothetical protein